MSIKLPRFDRNIPLVTSEGKPTEAFHRWWDAVARAVERAVADIEANVDAIEQALEAADIAIQAADQAQAAADAAQSAADSAQDAANGANALTSVVNSGTDINPLSASDAGSDATIFISTHNRLYPNGSSVAVDAGNFTGLPYGTVYWVYYDDPDREGGAVNYQLTTTEGQAAQAGDRHLVGRVTTPVAAAPPTTGSYKKYPGLELDAS